LKRVKAYLKCGHIVEFDTEELSTTRNALGQLTKLEWSKNPGTEALHTIEVDEIVAITFTDIPAVDEEK